MKLFRRDDVEYFVIKQAEDLNEAFPSGASGAAATALVESSACSGKFRRFIRQSSLLNSSISSRVLEEMGLLMDA